MVVRLAQTWASDAWMLRSVSVSSADVAWSRRDTRGGHAATWHRAAEQARPAQRPRLDRKGTSRPYLIQQDDAGVLEEGAGNGHALLLASAQLQAALAHLRVVACGHSRASPCPGGLVGKGGGSQLHPPNTLGAPSQHPPHSPAQPPGARPAPVGVRPHRRGRRGCGRGFRRRGRLPARPGRWRRCGRSGCCWRWSR